jgi:hypothetical protein
MTTAPNSPLPSTLTAADGQPPKPIVSLGRFFICGAFAAFVQIALFWSACVHEKFGNFTWGQTYGKISDVVYWPGLRLFWWITPDPAPFDIVYGLLAMLFLLVLYSVVFGAIASCSFGVACRIVRRIRNAGDNRQGQRVKCNHPSGR